MGQFWNNQNIKNNNFQWYVWKKVGTGFIVHESIIHTVREFKDINPRISIITLKTDNIYVVLINIHIPKDKKDKEKNELFYTKLENVFESVKGNIVLVVGDFNAKGKWKGF